MKNACNYFGIFKDFLGVNALINSISKAKVDALSRLKGFDTKNIETMLPKLIILSVVWRKMSELSLAASSGFYCSLLEHFEENFEVFFKFVWHDNFFRYFYKVLS